MKVLFVGGYHHYTTLLMTKMAKNGVELAVLNEEDKPAQLPAKHTKYTVDARHIARVYENFRPDLVMVTMAYDGGNYLDGLLSVLAQGAEHGLRRLIFLSSTAVYGAQPAEGVLPTEADAMKPASRQGVSFAAGEDLCRRWESTSSMKVTVLRLSGIYGPGAEQDQIGRMIAGLLRDKSLTQPRDAQYAPLYVDDMIEAMMQVVEAGFSPLYNLASSTVFTAVEIQQLLQDKTAATVKLEESRQAECHTADSSLFRSEYQWHERRNLQAELPGLVAAIQTQIDKKEKAHAREKQIKERDTTSKINWLGYVETVLVFAVAAFLTLIQTSTTLISGVDFIILYLVLIAVTMSLQQSALALLLSCGLLVFQQVQQGYDLFSAILNYNTLLKAAEYCIVGISVSYMIQRLKTRLQFAQLEMDEQSGEMKLLEQFSDDNLRSRRFFEDQILEYEVSLPRITAMTARLDTLEPERILPETIGILSETLAVDDVAAYLIGRRGGRMRLSFAQTGRAAAMGQSPLMEDFAPMLEALEDDQVYVNRSMDTRYPSMATGVKMNNTLAFVFVVWDVPFGKMRLDTSNLMQAITRLATAALNRAYQYEELTRNERYVEGTDILMADAFERLCQARKGSDGMRSGVVARITGEGNIAQLAEKLARLVRENDYLGLGNDGGLMVLLSGTAVEGYRLFETRLAEIGLAGTLLEEAV